jgi:HlyD family secretion protein
MNRRHIVVAAAVALLVIAAIFTRGFGLFGAGGGDGLTLYGNVDIREVNLGFRVPGRISRILVDEGDKVSAGQLLAVLDTATIEARVGEADAQVAQARAQLAKLKAGNRTQDIAQARARTVAAAAEAEKAQSDFTRRKALVDTGAISRALWQQTVSARDAAAAQLAEARQALALLEAGSRREDVAAGVAQLRAAESARRSASTDLSDTKLLASVDGTVVTRAQEPGAIIQPGATVLTLSIDRPLRVRAYVAESDLSRISPGMAVEVAADGNPRVYAGEIGHIAPRAEFTPKTVQTEDLRTDLVYRVRITVRNPDDALRQGQPVTVRIPSARPAGD